MDAQQLTSDRTVVPTVSTELPATADPFGEYPALSRLRLAAADKHELARQGFVSVEQRGNRTNYKLRFRRDGRQVVRFIGDAPFADIVKTELDRLQARRQICRELATLDRAARRQLRNTKTELEPLVKAYGWKFHGRDVRRPHPED
jgi:hypothetical protein